jgi:translation initiation factor IF-3
MSLEDAIRRAEESGLDLIEVAATADPPVCRIADLGKFKFEQDKRARDSKKNQHVSEVKEVRLRPRTDDHDLQVRVRAARRFLEEGHKVKVEVRFRGREATHPEVARDQIQRIAQGVSDIAIVERAPSLEGRSMFAILARGRGKGEDASRAAPGNATAGSAPPAGAAPANSSSRAANAAPANASAPTASPAAASPTPSDAASAPSRGSASRRSAPTNPPQTTPPAAGSNGVKRPA